VNCKPLDIARIVGLAHAVSDANHRFVRCMQPCELDGAPGWVLDRPIVLTVKSDFRCPPDKFFKAGERAQFTRIKDQYLRPLRGFGPGADVREFPGVDIDSVHAGQATA
jgi:hypothetical protein